MMFRRFLTVLVCFVLLAQGVFAEKTVPQTLVLFETSMGKIKVRLYDETPQHRDNFLKLVQEGFYDGLLFHRVIKDFMAQAGDPNSRNCDSTAHLGTGGLDYNIPAEIVFPACYHKRGALAAARLGDVANPTRQSSACQFYLVQGKCYTDAELNYLEQRLDAVLHTEAPFRFTDEQRRHYKLFGGTPHLDGQYTVFGEIIEGFDVLDKICKVATNASDRPTEDVVILRARVVKR